MTGAVMKRRVAILISGRGSNMSALIRAAAAAEFPAEISLVISNKADAVDKVTEVLTDGGETVALLGEVIPAKGEHRVIYNGHLDLAQ